MIGPDHIHLLCSLGRVPVPSLKQWVEYWKGRIAARWHGGSGSVPIGHADGTARELPRCGTTCRSRGGRPSRRIAHAAWRVRLRADR
jgi:hypothetical protein